MAVQVIWNDLPDETIRKSVPSFRKRLAVCIKVKDGHCEHSTN